jgi:hypothetical protein
MTTTTTTSVNSFDYIIDKQIDKKYCIVFRGASRVSRLLIPRTIVHKSATIKIKIVVIDSVRMSCQRRSAEARTTS